MTKPRGAHGPNRGLTIAVGAVILAAGGVVFFGHHHPEQRLVLRSAPRTAAAASSSSSPANGESTVAQSVLAELLKRGNGKAVAAAFVETTSAAFGAASASDEGNVKHIAGGDELVVVKAYGNFTPTHSTPFGVSPQPATIMISVYDVPMGRVISNSFLSGNPNDVLSIAGLPPVPSSSTVEADLRKMGTPQALDLSGT